MRQPQKSTSRFSWSVFYRLPSRIFRAELSSRSFNDRSWGVRSSLFAGWERILFSRSPDYGGNSPVSFSLICTPYSAIFYPTSEVYTQMQCHKVQVQVIKPDQPDQLGCCVNKANHRPYLHCARSVGGSGWISQTGIGPGSGQPGSLTRKAGRGDGMHRTMGYGIRMEMSTNRILRTVQL